MTTPGTDEDVDLMLAYDGEQGGAVELSGEDVAAKLQALGGISDLVRGYIEIETDAADERLAGLWGRVESGIDAQADGSKAARPAAVAGEGRKGILGRLAAWFEAHRGHFVTGAVSAAAVAVIMVVAWPQPGPSTTTVVVPPAPERTVHTKVEAAEATPAEVESLEVFQGSGTIVTMPNDDGGSTSVIWLAPADAEETMEDPI